MPYYRTVARKMHLFGRVQDREQRGFVYEYSQATVVKMFSVDTQSASMIRDLTSEMHALFCLAGQGRVSPPENRRAWPLDGCAFAQMPACSWRKGWIAIDTDIELCVMGRAQDLVGCLIVPAHPDEQNGLDHPE